MESALARELRENCSYLKDEGWTYSARLMELAADEIDRLTLRVEHLQDDSARGKNPVVRTALERMSLPRQTVLGSKVRHIVARMLAGR